MHLRPFLTLEFLLCSFHHETQHLEFTLSWFKIKARFRLNHMVVLGWKIFNIKQLHNILLANCQRISLLLFLIYQVKLWIEVTTGRQIICDL